MVFQYIMIHRYKSQCCILIHHLYKIAQFKDYEHLVHITKLQKTLGTFIKNYTATIMTIPLHAYQRNFFYTL